MIQPISQPCQHLRFHAHVEHERHLSGGELRLVLLISSVCVDCGAAVSFSAEPDHFRVSADTEVLKALVYLKPKK